jgi:Zn-dependent peptidase ImmA (M78 family)
MIIPSQVKIGGITYKVYIQNEWFECEGADGETFYNQKQGNCIYIKEDLSDESKIITLIHEALHCMNSTIDHECLDSLSEQLYQFLKDNDLLK